MIPQIWYGSLNKGGYFIMTPVALGTASFTHPMTLLACAHKSTAKTAGIDWNQILKKWMASYV